MINKVRLIAKLEIKGENVIKGMRMEGLRKVGKPEELVFKYFNEGIDEIVLVDTVASLYGRNYLIDLVSNTSSKIFIPLTVGGGVRSVNDMEKLLTAGADKVCVNTAAVKPSGHIKPFVGTPSGPVAAIVPSPKGSCAPATTASPGSQIPICPPAVYSVP